MVLWLDEDESFSLQGYFEAPGYIRTPLSGYLVQHRSDGVYAAPLLPQLFYGTDGKQLQTWRQYIPTAGSQVFLSRSGGQPSLPREELAWRKIRSYEPTPTQNRVTQAQRGVTVQQANPLGILILIGLALWVIGKSA